MPDLEERVAALEAALAMLTRRLLESGDITINDARAAMGPSSRSRTSRPMQPDPTPPHIGALLGKRVRVRSPNDSSQWEEPLHLLRPRPERHHRAG